MVGGSCRRKPVHGQVRLSPSASVNCSASPTEKTAFLDNPSGEFPDLFEGEIDSDLFAGFLSEVPTGSSTPKRTSVDMDMHDGDSAPKSRLVSESEASCSTDLISEFDDTGELLTSHTTHDSLDLLPSGRVKKHPSPSKKALEDLETAFVMYARLKTFEGNDNMDELSANKRKPLGKVDSNRKLRLPGGLADASTGKPASSVTTRRRRFTCQHAIENDQKIDDLQL